MKKTVLLITLLFLFILAGCAMNNEPQLNVYISGVDGSTAKWWTNDVEQSGLSGGNIATSVFVYKGDVYICGIGGNYARWWKNGVSQPDLPGGEDATKILVSQGIVYISGYNISSGKAMFWKNGIGQELADGKANSIFVSPY